MPRRTIGIQTVAFALLLSLTFSLPFMKPSVGLVLSAITPTDVLFPIVFAACIAAVAVGAIRFTWTFEYWAFLFYFCALFLSAIFSTNVQTSFLKLAAPVYLILLAVTTASIVTTAERMRYLILAWLIGSAVTIAAGFLAIGLFYFAPHTWVTESLTSHSGAVPVGYLPRVASTFITPSMFCNFLTVTVVIALAAKGIGWIGRVPALILIAALTICAVFTFSIALGGFFLAIGIWLWFERPEEILTGRAVLIAGVLIALASLAVAPFALPADLWSSTDIFSVVSSTESSRYIVWRESLQTFLSHPFTGTGIGTAAANVVFRNYDGSVSLLTDAHNTFLSVAAQAGVIGLISILVLCISVSKSALSQRTRSKTGILRLAFAIAFLTAFVFEGLTGSFEDARHLWVLIGLIIAARRIDANSEDISTSLNRA